MQITLNNGIKVDFKIEIDNEGVSIKLTSCTLPEALRPKPKFREDMNVHLAVEELKNEYIDEATRRCKGMKGEQSRIAEMLGFKSYQAYRYWQKRQHNNNRKKEEN